MQAQSFFLLAFAVIMANLPWLFSSCLLFFRFTKAKSTWLRLLEWGIYGLLTMAVALYIEFKSTGDIYQKGWEFYTIFILLFLCFLVSWHLL